MILNLIMILTGYTEFLKAPCVLTNSCIICKTNKSTLKLKIVGKKMASHPHLIDD